MALSSEPLKHQTETNRLRGAWLEGLESGQFEAFDIEAIKQKARARLASLPGPEQSP